MTTANSTLETLLNEHDVARITGLSVASVRRWRLLRQGPKYLKIGAAVRYKPKDVLAWLSSHGFRRRTPFRERLYACLGRLAVSAGVEVVRAVVHHVLSKLG
jgi:predicted DNA-binding transcriptional regulator AlpA